MGQRRKDWVGLPGDPIRVRYMANACLDEAMRIRQSQKAWVDGGLITDPDPQMMRTADLFEAASRLLDDIAPKTKEVLKIIRPGK